MKLIKILKQIISEQNLSIITTDEKYHEFFVWLMRFQQQKTRWVPPEFKNLKEELDLVQNKSYKLYRGLYFKSPSAEIKSLKVGQSIPDEGTSWSTIYEVAAQFAKDNPQHFGKSSTWTWKEGKSIGIVIENTFQYDDIMCDLLYMYDNGFKRIEYPKESEVIVFKKQNNCKIVEVITSSKRKK